MLEVEIKKEINRLVESENSISTSLPAAANLFLVCKARSVRKL